MAVFRHSTPGATMNPPPESPVVRLMSAGMAHQQAGRIAEAEAAYREVLALAPEHPDAIHYLGLAASQRGDVAEAAALMDRALRLAPRSAVHWSNRATLYAQQGQEPAAEAFFRRSLELNPASVPNWMNLATLLRTQGRTEETLEVLARVLALAPDDPGALALAGRLHLGAERPDEALPLLERAAALAPGSAEAQVDLALCHRMAGRLEAAEAAVEAALRLRPGFPPALNARGLIHTRRFDFAAAEAAFRAALAVAPDMVDARHNLALTVADQMRHAEAEALLHEVLAARPEKQDARLQIGIFRLQQGDLAAGFAGWEHRPGGRPALPFPEWRGEDLRGRRIVLLGEQGYGDHIQFVRFAKVLADRGATVDVVAIPPILDLLATAPGVNAVAPHVGDGPYDYWCKLMGVPHRLGLALADVPADVPYLGVDPARVARWGERIAAIAGDRRRIGLVWAGNPEHKRDAVRSMALADLAPLADVPGVAWFSLQKGPAEAELADPPPGLAIHPLGAELEDYADTAAALEALDLVIAVDTSVAHLAGARGRPVWVALSALPDWRWLLGRADSPWYPTARLFRQPAAGDWAPLAQELRNALAADQANA